MSFLFFLSTFVHTLTAAQGRWYGWVANAVIAAVIAVFLPIAPLRAALVWFLELVLFHQNSLLQIAACIVLGLAIFMINRTMLNKQAA